tara:strand:+ start:223 stop:789 length:567 start_codon:yes stop_codon:yes gene_type:complete
MKEKKRCSWCTKDSLYIEYHDKEWGIPVFDDTKLFEFLILEIFQAGLSWYTILNKRKNFIDAFDNFNFNKIAKYDSDKIFQLLNNEGIIRNKLKIISTISNAKSFISVINKYGSFYKYINCFKKDINNSIEDIDHSKIFSPLALIISNDLKKKGFKFIGPKIIYAFLLASGFINGHEVGCYKYSGINN